MPSGLTYAEAVEAIESGDPSTKYAWRSSWTGWYIYYAAPNVCINKGTSDGPYTPSEDDMQATDWEDGGDKPPRAPKAKK